jgi:3-methylcrotonyl-CoA carboxylase alpha subunit
MKVVLESGGRVREANVTRTDGRVLVRTTDGLEAEFELVAAAAGDTLILGAGGAQLVWVRGARLGPHARQLRINEHTVWFTDAATVREDSAADPALAATIPSVVLEVLVAAGQTVAAGDRLLLLESMKMVMPIAAPSPGTVRAVLCAPGQSVEPGQPLVDFEPAEAQA